MMNQRGGFRPGGGKGAQGRGGGGGGGGGGKFQNPANRRNQNPNVKGAPLSCPVCNFRCATMQNLRTHFQKTNHKPPGGDNDRRGNRRDSEAADAPEIIPDHIRRSVFLLKDYLHRADREPIIGLEQVVEYRLQTAPGKTDVKYYCEVCDSDGDLVAMMEHLTCYRHRKLSLMKAYPYVLKAPSGGKEDRTQFMKRMATEIEQEEGTKMYKMDPTVRTVPMMKSREKKKSKQKTRWNYEGDRQSRMKKALEYLESFDIDNDDEATTVTRLTEKLIAELKFHSDKLKEEALFPAKVARAKDVAMSIMQNAPRGRAQKNPLLKGPPEGRPGPPQADHDKPYWTPHPAFPDMENAPTDLMAKQGEQPDESKFFNKLKSLLSVLPQNSAPADSSQMKSKLLMLKSLLLDKKASQANASGNQLMHGGAPLAPDTASMSNPSLNQQMGMGQFGQNFMGENVPGEQNSLIQMAALLQNSQMNPNVFMSDNQNFQNMEFMDMGNSSVMPMDQMGYQEPYVKQQLGFDNIQSSEDFGYDGRMAGNFGNNSTSQYEGYAAEPAPYTRVSLSPSIQRSGEERFRDDGHRRDSRRDRRPDDARPGYGGRRSFEEPAWAEKERDTCYGKRVKLDGDRRRSHSSERGRRRRDGEDGGGSKGPNLSIDLLKRIRGKDLFTVSAILSEYSESHSQ
ncbi:uncharacterized protein ACMZJ9_003604 [Mantella aurantiaca]